MNIYLVTDIAGFPFGTAATKRIKMIGKAVILSGNTFTVLTNTIIPNKYNNSSNGCFEGISYKYLHGSIKNYGSKFTKISVYLKGLWKLRNHLSNMNRKNDLIYIYSHGSVFNFYASFICKINKLKIIQEINEWDYLENKSFLKEKILKGPMIKWADGAIVISNSIKENVHRINSQLKTFSLPVLEDPCSFNFSKKTTSEKYCFWMGLVDGYINDVIFLIQSSGIAYRNGSCFSIVISGPFSNESMHKIREASKEWGFPYSKIKMLGYIEENELVVYIQNAYFYVVPLWNNQKSVHRFPTKLATFMFSAKPTITCKLGEVGNYFEDFKNILFYKAGDAIDLAEKITLVLNNSELYNLLADNSRLLAINNFDYSKYSVSLISFFKSILSND